MDTVTKRLYEGLFLVDSAEAAADWQGIQDAINGALAKGGAEVVDLKKWDERKLAYDVNGKSRGTYLLCYFNAETDKIRAIERTVQLSEKIIRVMILRADQMSAEDMAKDTPLMMAAAQEAAEIEAAKQARAEETEASGTAEGIEPDDDADFDEESDEPTPDTTEPETE